MPVAWWNEAVHRHSLAVYHNHRPTPQSLNGGSGWLLGNVSQLNWYARRGG